MNLKNSINLKTSEAENESSIIQFCKDSEAFSKMNFSFLSNHNANQPINYRLLIYFKNF